jgi:transcriptional antiterminator RfaH
VEHWFALFAKPRMEYRVADTLAARGLDTWVPTLQYHGRRGNALERPFFPRYLFARFDWDQVGGVNIQWTPGLSRLVTFDGHPSWLDDRRLEFLRSRLSGVDGDAFLALKPGERVRVRQGPFQDMEAVFDRRMNGTQRVAILLDILGRRTPVVVSADDIERIA